MKKLVCVILFLALTLMGCRNEDNTNVKPKPKPKVNMTQNLSIITTNKLLYYMTKDIVKDNHDVDYMLKTEADEWNYEYTDDALDNISNKNLFIYFGAGFEPWVDDFLGDIKGGKVTNLNGSRGTQIIKRQVPIEYGDKELTDNPYYWMDPGNYKILMSNIKTTIEEKDPQNRKIYEDNFNENIKKLSEVQDSMKPFKDSIKKYTFVTYGDEFDYLLQSLGIKPLKIYDDTVEDDIKEKLDDTSEDTKGVIFLYGNENLPENCRELIEEYNMKKAVVINYSYSFDYIELLKYDYDIIKNSVETYNQ